MRARRAAIAANMHSGNGPRRRVRLKGPTTERAEAEPPRRPAARSVRAALPRPLFSLLLAAIVVATTLQIGDTLQAHTSRRSQSSDKIPPQRANEFPIDELLSRLEDEAASGQSFRSSSIALGAGERPAERRRARRATTSAHSYRDLMLATANEHTGRAVPSDSVQMAETSKWHLRVRDKKQGGRAPYQRTRAAGADQAVVEQPPTELMFSNQTGAVIQCGVAYELAQGIARAERQRALLQQQQHGSGDTLLASGPSRAPSIQIRWEKESGEEIEQLLHASSEPADPLDEHPSRPPTRRPLLRYVRASDGALVFEPFRPFDFRPDVHATTYRCVATAVVATSSSTQPAAGPATGTGASASVVSRDMRVRGIVAPAGQSIQIEVLDELVVEGNLVIFKCQVPAYAQAYLQLVDWLEYPSERSFSAQSSSGQLDLALAELTHPTLDANSTTGSSAAARTARHFVHPKSGDLIIQNVDSQLNYRAYKCRCKNKLTGELISSLNRGKLIVSESRAPIAPKLSGYSLSPTAATQLGREDSAYEEGELALLVCHLSAFPRASISWFRQSAGEQLEPIAQLGENATRIPSGAQKFVQLQELLFIRRVHRNDSGQFTCVARNLAGEERHSASLQVRARLRVKLSVSSSVLELGKSLALECSISGFPIHQVTFRHNQNVIKSISGSESLAAQPDSSATVASDSSQPSARNYFVLDDSAELSPAADAPAPSSSPPGSPGQLDDGDADANDQLQLKDSVKLSHVVVIVLEPQHAGAYQCFAHNQFESSQSVAYLRVLDDPPKFKHTFKGEVHQQGQDISLHCSARANPLPEITWSVDEQPISVDQSNRIRFGDFVTKDNLVISYVNISQAQVADSGLYRCTADNRLAQVTHEAQVQVMGEPIVKPMPNVTVLASTTFRQRCPVGGYPVGEIQWHHNGHRLPANHRQHVYDNGTLEVEHMEKSAGDEGEYICLVSSPSSAGGGSNKESTGKREALGSVHVSIRVRPTIEPFSLSRQLREGQRASIMCTISSGDPPISISWFRNDQLLVQDQVYDSAAAGAAGGLSPVVLMVPGAHKSPLAAHDLAGESSASGANSSSNVLPGVRISRVSDYSSTLLFESLLSQHSANYTCLARNDAGSVSHVAPMTVQVAPKWLIEPADTSVVRGTASSIDCMASGFPPPRIIWTKAASGDQVGGPASALPPSAAIKQQDAKPPADASGRASSAFHLGTWRSIVSSPHLRVFENGSLNVMDARDSDQGHYMCQASNGVGPGLSKVIRVTINVAAQFLTRHAVQYVARGEPAHLKCQARGDWPLLVGWLKNKQRLEAVNLQEASQQQLAALFGAGAVPPSAALISSTVGSALLLPLEPGAQLNHSLAGRSERQSAGSIADQLSAWFSSSGAPAPGGGQSERARWASGAGLLMARYSLLVSEHLLSSSQQRHDLHQLAAELRQQRSSLQLSGAGAVAQQQLLQQLSSPAARLQPSLVQSSSALEIQQAERQDTGAFRCLAANAFGVDERTIQLIVQEPPDRVEELSVVETNSRSVTLGWLAPYDGNAPITSYHIHYRAASTGSVAIPAGQSPAGQRLAAPLSSEALDSLVWSNYSIASDQANSIHANKLTGGELSNRLGAGQRAPSRVTINSLRPLTHYWFRLEAENKLGRGPPSSIVETVTMEEAPGAAPDKVRAAAQSSASILVSWFKLNEKEAHGSVHGYYVAYKPIAMAGEPLAANGSSSSSKGEPAAVTNIYKTIQHDDKLTKFDALLTGLRKSTKYVISVQAFNARGTGPSSEPIIVRTLDLDPPRQLKLFVKQATNCSIEIEWRPLSVAALARLSAAASSSSTIAPSGSESAPGEGRQSADADIVDYYSLYQAELNEQPHWREFRLPGHASSHSVERLKCGTRYQFYAMGVNKIGLGDQSDILDTKTAGGLPVAPDRQSTFDVINTTCYIVRLDHWQDNGCPIQKFSIRSRLEPSREWLQVAHFDFGPPPAAGEEPKGVNIARNVVDDFESKLNLGPRPKWKRSLVGGSNEEQFGPADTIEDSGEQDEDSNFIDYPAADEQQLESDYSALEAASLVSKAEATQYASLLNEAPISVELKSSSDQQASVSTRQTVKGMPRYAQEWQASNFVIEAGGAGETKESPKEAQKHADWRRVRLCNLAENVYYTVQIRAENRVGETEAELRLLTSPQGLEYDHDIKRHVVSRLSGTSGGGDGGHRMAHSMINLNERFNGLISLNQWPVLVPVMIALTLMTIVIIIALLLRKSSAGRGHSPNSSLNSASTTLNLNGNGGPHCQLGAFAEDPPPSPSSARPNQHIASLYQQSDARVNGAATLRHHHHPPSSSTEATGSDLVMGSSTVDSYATVTTMPPRSSVYVGGGHQFGNSMFAQPDNKLDFGGHVNVNEMTLASIYQQRAAEMAQQQQYAGESPYGLNKLAAGGSLSTNMATNSSVTDNQTTTGTIPSTNSPSTTAPLSMNSSSTNGGPNLEGLLHDNAHQQQHFAANTLPPHFHQAHNSSQMTASGVENSRGLNVYLCTSKDEQEPKQQHQQEAAIFYGLNPQQAQLYGHQVQMRRFEEDLGHQQAMEQQLVAANNSGEQHECDHQVNGLPGGQNVGRVTFDPVYSTIRRTVPQAFKYLTLQHHQHHQQARLNQDMSQLNSGN